MKSLRPKLTALALTALLAALVLLPQRVSEMRDSLLIGTLHTEAVPETTAEPSTLSTEEKIALLIEADGDAVDIATISQNQFAPSEAVTEQARTAIGALTAAGLLPAAPELAEALAGAQCQLMTCADLNEPSRFIRLVFWSYSAGSSNFDLTLDADTGLAYHFTLYDPEGRLTLDLDADALPDRLGKYLGVTWENVAFEKPNSLWLSTADNRIGYRAFVPYGKIQDGWYQVTPVSGAYLSGSAAVSTEKQ